MKRLLLFLILLPFAVNRLDALWQDHVDQQIHEQIRRDDKPLPPGPLWKVPGFPHPQDVFPPPPFLLHPLATLEA